MSRKVTVWLQELGLGQYATAFEENELELDQLIDLNDEDMKDLGVTVMGHRKKLFRAIKALPAISAPAIEQSDATALSQQPASPPVTESERRQLTVMFCDLARSRSQNSTIS